ncbi:MAG: HYR domain-containing protein [Saprospiraceae bacterium]|nr:HYR domain-containing protein [Saprospiraceae bacterium]
MKYSSKLRTRMFGVAMPIILVVLHLITSPLYHRFSTVQTSQVVDAIDIDIKSKCLCNPSADSYIDTVVVTASPGMTWELISNQYANLIGLPEESPAGSGNYLFVIEVLGPQAYFINLVSDQNDYVTISFDGCAAKNVFVSGPISVCFDAAAIFSIRNNTNMVNYTWQAPGATIISSNPLQVNVAFGNSSAQIVLTGIPTSGFCLDTLTHLITVGAPVTQDFACINQINVSLDNNCVRTVNLDELIAGPYPQGSALALQLTDDAGIPIPGNILDERYIGKTVTASVLDGCGGNSCWGMVRVEDKKAPVIECPPAVTIECYKEQYFPGLQVVAECSDFQIFPVGSTLVEELSCDPNYLRRMVKKSVAVDAFGNRSDTCTQEIFVNKFPLDEVIFPRDTVFSCDFSQGNELLPALTGYPSIGNTILNEVDYPECKIAISYNDTKIAVAGKTKIIRTWSIFEWSCDTMAIRTDDQFIFLVDQVAPIIVNCPSDMKRSTGAHDCTAQVQLAKLGLNDVQENCNGSYTVDIDFPNGRFANVVSSTNTAVDLPIGENLIIYTVTDAAGLTSQCQQIITVTDRTPPVAACIDSLVVSLADANTGITVSMIDLQSYDACGPVSLKLRRVDSIAVDSTFKDVVHVTCQDLNRRVMIELTVTDQSGNTNRCMTSVLVEDKIPPVLEVPEDVTISCSEWLAIDSIETFGQAVAYDQCNVVIQERVDTSLNVCKVGTITRTFTAISGQFRIVKSQRIFVVASPSFNPDSIIAPADLTISNTCSLVALHPDSLAKIDIKYGRPIINHGGCDLIGVHYDDKLYTVADGGPGNCQKVLRTWKILNYCDGNGSTIVREMIQIIKLSNTIAPKINALPDSLKFSTFNCFTDVINLNASATDDCTAPESLIWKYRIISQETGKEIKTGTSQGPSISISPTLSVGFYKIIWTVTDLCANFAEKQQIIVVKNAKGATIFAHDTVVTALTAMVTTEMSCVNVNKLIIKSEHPCGYAVKYSFSPTDLSDTIRCFDCSNLGFNSLNVFAIDTFGTAGQAVVVISVQDNNNESICNSFESCITWPADTTIQACLPNLNPGTINSMPRVKPDCACNQFSISNTDVLTQSGACTTIERTFTVTFTCNNSRNEFSRKQIITAINRAAPVVNCPASPVRLRALTGCSVSGNIQAPTVADSTCHTGLITSYRIGDGPVITGANANGIFNVGTTSVTYFVTDACGNSGSCTFNVVVDDGAPPICRVRNISINLNAAGIATIADPSVFNNGTFDECNNLPLTFSVDRSQFSCIELGMSIPVNVTVADASGNSSTCVANVTPIDTMRPICTVNDLTIDITDAQPFTILSPADVIMNVSDNCNIMQDTILSKTFFSCADLGTQILRVVVRDQSGNSSSCEATITVRDRIAPVCQLKSDTIMVSGGTVRIDSSNINNGSFDPCGNIVSFTVSPNTFTCADLGLKTVTATITDAGGNVSTCNVTILIQDGGQPICRAKDITVFLNQNGIATISAEDLDNGSGTGCSNPVVRTINRTQFTCADVAVVQDVILTITNPTNNLMAVCTSRVTVRDTLAPSLICTAEDVTVSCSVYNGTIPAFIPRAMMGGGCDKTGFELDSTIIRLPRPCNLDTLTRTYRLISPAGELVSTCVQTIRVVNDKPLTLDSFNLPPAVMTINNCSTTNPSQIPSGQLTLKAGVNPGCSAIRISFTDTYNATTCNDTLRRTWTISDSCNGFAPLVYRQAIAIVDNVAPLIVGARDTIVYNLGDCGRNLTFPQIMIQDCDPSVRVKNNNALGLDTNSVNPAGFYPIGIHNIVLTATDKCGNVGRDTFRVEVRDTAAVDVSCKSASILVGENGTAVANASDLINILGASVCNEANFKFRAVFRLSQAINDTSSIRTYNCSQLSSNGSVLQLRDTITLDIYNTVNGIDTLYETCSTVITVIDSLGNCAASLATINGTIMTENATYVPDFKVMAEGRENETFSMTNKEGYFAISGKKGDQLVIHPIKDNDFKQGVNTLDLLHIQRHILRKAPFKSPYQMIAADVNNDQIINVIDLVELQNMVLGKVDRFAKNTSWKAIDANYRFDDLENALSSYYPTSYEIDELRADMVVDFTAVKIGDVDNSYAPSNLQEVTPRSSVQLVAIEKSLGNGLYAYQVSLPKDAQWAGIQMAFETNGVEVKSIQNRKTGKDIPYYQKGNVLKLIWLNDEQSVQNYVGTEDVLEIISNGALAIEKPVTTSDGFESVYFGSNDEKFQIVITGKKVDRSLEFMVAQNHPNPWSDQTVFDIQTGVEGNMVLVVRDIAGRIISTSQHYLSKGKNSIPYGGENIVSAGVYFAELKQNNISKIIKMIVTK